MRISVDELRILGSIAQQLENGLAKKLGSKGQPGHVDYISKTDASVWCKALSDDIRKVIENVGQRS